MNTLADYAALLLAKALKDLFPKVQLVGGFSQTSRFSYDFIADFPVDDQALKFLCERMQDMIRKEIPISCHEMMPAVAGSMFNASGERVWSGMLKEVDKNGLVSVVRIGDQYFLGEAVSSMKGVVGLVSIEQTVADLPRLGPTSLWRITGFAEKDAASLKERVKLAKTAVSTERHPIFRKVGDEIIFTGRGARALRDLEKSCAETYEKQNFEFIKAPPGGARLEWIEGKTAEVQLAFRDIPSRDTRGLWLSKTYHRDASYQFVPLAESREALISSLHFIQKNANIFGIEGLWSPKRGGQPLSYEALIQNASVFKIELKKGQSISWKFALHYVDAFLEPWEGPSIELSSVPKEVRAHRGFKDEVLLIKTSLFGSFERFLAFSLEKNKALIWGEKEKFEN